MSDVNSTQKAIEQALAQAQYHGDCALIFFAMAIALASISFVFWVRSTDMNGFFFLGWLCLLLGFLSFITGVECSNEARKARETPELYIMEKFSGRKSEAHYVPIIVR